MAERGTKKGETKYMKEAIRRALLSPDRDADDLRPRPKVAAVVVKNGKQLATAHRGETGDGDHAEYAALEKKLKKDSLEGATVYTTLEPCTTGRKHPKQPCASWLAERRVARVVIGMLDPDPRICGRGIRTLRDHNIAIDLFPNDLMSAVEEQNREFTRYHQAVSLNDSRLSDAIKAAGLTNFVPSREYYKATRAVATIDKYVSQARRTICIVSINLMTGVDFDDLCRSLSDHLQRQEGLEDVKISLLDPKMSQLMEVVAPILNMSADKLASSISDTLGKLVQFKQSLRPAAAARVSVRVHNTLPFGSAIIMDHEQDIGKIQIETKPYRAGINKSFAIEFGANSPSGLYSELVRGYLALVADGRDWDI